MIFHDLGNESEHLGAFHHYWLFAFKIIIDSMKLLNEAIKIVSDY